MDQEVETKKTYVLVIDTKQRAELTELYAHFIAENDLVLITPEDYVDMQDSGILTGLPQMPIEEVRLYTIKLDDMDFTDIIEKPKDIRPQRQAIQEQYGKNYFKQNRFRRDYIPNKRKNQRHGKRNQ